MDFTDTPEKNELTLGEVIAALRQWRWRIAAIAACTVAFGVAYVAVTPKAYRADALVQLDQSDPDRSGRREGDLMALEHDFKKKSNVAAEIAVIRSRMLLGSVVDALNLDLAVQPLTTPTLAQLRAAPWSEWGPLLGSFFSPKPAHTAPPVTSLTVPDNLLDKPLTLLVGDKGEVTLLDHEQRLLVRGLAGEPITTALPQGELHLAVNAAAIAPGARYSVIRKSRIAAITDLAAGIKVGEEGEHSGTIRISLEGANRALTGEIVRTIVRSYEEIHALWRSRDVLAALAYLNEQLPVVRAQAIKAETALSRFQETNSLTSLGVDGARLLDRVSQLEVEVADRKRQLENFTSSHPAYKRISSEVAVLNRQIADLDARIGRLPRVQERAVDLSRNAKVTSELYAQLMRNAQELEIVKAALSSDIRIIDPGDVLPRPVKPKPAQLLLITLLAGLFIGAAGALIQYRRRGLDDPDLIEALLRVPVYATIPFIPRRRLAEQQRGSALDGPRVLALQAPTDMAVESLRSLRTWLNTGEFKRSKKGLLITGPTQGVGKTFISTNLAAVLASAGRRVLLIDADMRKGNVDRLLGLKAAPGLSEFLRGEISEIAAVSRAVGGFHCITRGSVDPHCSELLLNGRFAQLMAAAYSHFDDVIIDTSPILAISDAMIIGQFVGSALLVARANVNTAAQLLEAKKRLIQADIPLRGVVFNGVDEAQMIRYGYQYSVETSR